MNKYAEIALIAAQAIKTGTCPVDAWESASCKIFKPGSSSQKKGCPKNAFLGLYGGRGVNAEYAQKAMAYLQSHGSINISEQELWDIVTNSSGKKHNSQMHVVLVLFNNGFV